MFNKARTALLENSGTRQILVKNTFWLSLVEIVAKIVMFAVTILVVRYFGAAEFGRLNYAQSLVGITMLLSDFGLSTILIRDIARDKSHINSYLSSAGFVQMISILLVFLSVLLTVSSDRYLFLLITGFLLIQSVQNLLNAVLTAYESMQHIFLSRLVHYLGIFLSVIVVISLKLDVISLIWLYIISALLSVGYSILAISTLGVRFLAKLNPKLTKSLIKESLPIFATLAVNQIYLNIDTLMIRHFQSNLEVGYYSAAYKILFAFQGINLIAAATYPRISALYHAQKHDQLKRLVRAVLGWGSALLVPFVVMTYFYSPLIIETIFGTRFLPSASVLPYMITAGLFVFYRAFLSNFVLAAGEQKKIFYSTTIVLIINTLLNLVLIPRFGFVSGGISLVISELFFLIGIVAMTINRK